MPLYMEPVEVDTLFDRYESVLFVACDVCPRMCMAVKRKEPCYTLGQLFGARDFYFDYVAGMRELLKSKGIRTGVFKKGGANSMMCLWPEAERDRLREMSREYQAVAVIGCESAALTVENSAGSTGAVIVQMMKVEGVANFKTKYAFPFTITLEKPEGDFFVKRDGR